MVVTVVCSHDEYTVERERAGALENCYVSVLVIHSAGRGGAGSGPRGRQFSLRLENEHGAEIHRATVTMGEELSTQTLIGRQQYNTLRCLVFTLFLAGSVVGVGATFLLVLCLAICWCRKCCRAEKQLKPDPER